MTSHHASARSAKPRDLRLDSIRGALLLYMAVNHIDSDLRHWLDQPLGFVTSAEGFVFLSGLLMGTIARAKPRPPSEEFSQARQRAGRAYLWHAVGLAGVWLWVQGWLAAGQETPWRLPYLFHHAPVEGLLAGLSLLYQPGMLDILPMYVVFPFLALGLLRLHRAGWGQVAWFASGALWLADQWLLPPRPLEWGPINTGAFHLLAWQWPFTSGVLLGAARDETSAALRRPRPWLVVAVTGVALLLFGMRRFGWPAVLSPEQLVVLTGKPTLAVLRWVNFAALAFLLALVVQRRPQWFEWRPLAAIGQHPLPVFTVSIWTTQMALSYPDLGDSPVGRWGQTLFVLGAIAATTAGCVYYRRWHRRRYDREGGPRTVPAPASL
ncbi:MAG TPA: OpgC domain-containing protein [Opitutaceae bacterium]|nr:OpgC domain-containing protein [Opitutaceae bacterium]